MCSKACNFLICLELHNNVLELDLVFTIRNFKELSTTRHQLVYKACSEACNFT